MRFDLYGRLEPIRPDGSLDEGFRAEVADPAWFLGQQWLMGEHQGEDAASPVMVTHTTSHTAIDPLDGEDPGVTPAEVIVEAGPGDWWTPGRRLRLGAAAAPFLAGRSDLRFGVLPPPYDGLADAYDGWAVFRLARAEVPASVFAEVPAEATDMWDYAELVHTATFTAGGSALEIPRHDGGDVDWYSVHTSGPITTPAPRQTSVIPSRLTYPGAPHPRWWQIEDAHVDIGGVPPDRSHFATMLLTDLVISHADDWFTFPIDCAAGSVVTLHSVEVRDAFDQVSVLNVPADWTLYAVTGLAPSSLLVWPTVTLPLRGSSLDDVVVGVDEDANLLWAVEQRADGRELAPPPPPVPPDQPVTGTLRADARNEYGYRPSTRLPRYWHPYEIHEIDGRRRYVQARLADLELRPPGLLPQPVSPLLTDPAAPTNGPAHQIEPATIPTTGLRLDRRYVLGRRTTGEPILWRQRSRIPLLTPPVSALRFDVLEEQSRPI
ncbi:hypothetical protein [Nonomuraea sediminis]|uniref:hypothetical protein n=1 Tax=Nonomuraea sediminis TaxID=2835864 RepID=UPI001BDD2991|nr:hypothetical protein [Nonomuraea sediminis]